MDHRVQFTGPTGANAVEAAMKLARKATGRSNFISFTRGFHGLSYGALAATANSTMRGGPVNALSGVFRLPYEGYLGPDVDTADQLALMLADPSSGVDAPGAILLETGGLNVASPEWLRRVAALASAHGALLIIDDIQAGCGRTGTFFSFEPAGITPDIVVLSKSLSGFGLPMAVLLMRPEIEVDPALAAQITRTSIRNRLIIERAGPRDEVVKVLAPLTTPDEVLDRGLDILAAAAAEAVHAHFPTSA
jgi:diaminobutyrate-2-oxoglutarate transaminase